MKQSTSTILSVISLVGVIVLFILHFRGGPGNSMMPAGKNGAGVATRIAYVDIDTFEAHFEYLKTKREAFQKKQIAMESELQRSAQQLQNAAAAFQKKAQAGGMTQAEGDAEQRRLGQMQQSLETRQQALQQQLVKEQDVFNADLKKRLDKFLEDYNKNKTYDYILSYSASSPFLYVNKSLDITADVIRGMNDRNRADNTTDSTSK